MRLVYILLTILVVLSLFTALQPALGPASVVVTKTPEVQVKVPTEFQVETFCREDEAQTAVVTDLAKKGFQYIGVLNANGINCNQVLFGK